MASNGITMNGRELKKQAALEGLDRECLRLKSPFKHKEHCNSVFTPKSVSTGGSGMSTLTYVAMGATVLAAAAPLVIMAVASGGSQAPQGAGQVSSKAVLGMLGNAEDSGDAKVIDQAIKEGKRALQSVDGQINAAQAELDAAKKDVPAIQGNFDNQKNKVIPEKNKELDKLNQSVKGDKGSKGLAGKRDSEIAKVPRMITEAGPGGKPVQKPNPKYDEEVNKIKQNYEKPIADAIDIEEKQIPAKEREIKEAEEKLKDLEQQLDKAKEKAEKAQEKLDKLTPERQKIDDKVKRLERQLATIQSSTKTDGETKTDGVTAPAGEDTPPPIAAATRTSEELGKDLLKDLNSDGTTPAATTSDATKTDKPDSHLGADTTPAKKENPETVSFNISNARTTTELDFIEGEIDKNFGKGSEDSKSLHNKIEEAKKTLFNKHMPAALEEK